MARFNVEFNETDNAFSNNSSLINYPVKNLYYYFLASKIYADIKNWIEFSLKA
jgi:hypothetical protein